jgi:hypothetical protein
MVVGGLISTFHHTVVYWSVIPLTERQHLIDTATISFKIIKQWRFNPLQTDTEQEPFGTSRFPASSGFLNNPVPTSRSEKKSASLYQQLEELRSSRGSGQMTLNNSKNPDGFFSYLS